MKGDTKSVKIDGDIHFDSVNFTYPSREDVSILHDLSFVASAGETTALVGASGCGKCEVYGPTNDSFLIEQARVLVCHFYFVCMSLRLAKSRSMVDR